MTSSNDAHGEEPRSHEPTEEGAGSGGGTGRLRRRRRRRRQAERESGKHQPVSRPPASGERPGDERSERREPRESGKHREPRERQRQREQRGRPEQRNQGERRPDHERRDERGHRERPEGSERRETESRRESGRSRDQDRGRSRERAHGRTRERDRDRDRRREPEPSRERKKPPARPRGSAKGFERFGLPQGVIDGLADADHEQPTEIQERMIPVALEGLNVVARSRTGTGKTCAFLVPSYARLEEVRAGGEVEPHGPVRILVVVPTRELAIQVAGESERLSRFLPIRTACVYGGTQLKREFNQIPYCAVVVGTPGRLLDHLRRRTLDGATVEVLVLDEVDRMYDLGFRDDVDRIIEACSRRKQSILVSATLNDDVEDLVEKHLHDHERIEIQSRSLTVDEVEQTFYVIRPDRKRELLMALLRARRPERAIVFTRTRFTADRVAYVLQREGFDAHEIHSGLPQRRREEIMGRFRAGRLALLVATDVAARGLDIQGIDHVVNYDIPQTAEDYVHRVGRTARMGQEGWAVTLVVPDDGIYLTAIEKLINKQIRQERFEGFDVSPQPEPPPKPPPDPRPARPEGDRADESEATEGDTEAAPATPDATPDATPEATTEEDPKAETRIPGIPRWARPARRRRR